MTENNDNSGPSKDFVLVEFIKNVEAAEQNRDLGDNERYLEIILSVRGMLINGELISSTTYFKELFEENNGNEEKEAEQPVSEERHFIHLRNAKFFMTGSTAIPGEGSGFLWRGRLTAIDGFTLGKLELVERKPQQIKIGPLKISAR
jgi:hypothetical protein